MTAPGHQRRSLRVSAIAAAVAVAVAIGGAGVVTIKAAFAATLAAPVKATSPGSPCPVGAPTRSYAVSLINIPLFLNRFGDVIPEGRMYVLDENITKARETFASAADPYNPRDIIEPLTLRANKGDCVDVTFTNRLNEPAPNFERNKSIFLLPGEKLLPPGTVTPNPREFAPALSEPKNDFDPANAPPASMHFTGLTYDVLGSDGTAAGFNTDSTVNAGATTSYRLYADVEGEFLFQDGADLTSAATGHGNLIGSNGFGAFGAIVVEPVGATWVDVYTGAPLRSGMRAVIKNPNGRDYREHVTFMQDEIEAEPGILTRFCEDGETPPAGSRECVVPTAEEKAKLTAGTIPALGGGDADALVNGQIPVKLEWHGFGYRSEPGANREEVGCPPRTTPNAAGCVGEETALSSWPYGDPGGGDLVFANYRGEPTKVRAIHGAEKETHTFHWHVNRWPSEPEDEGGIDSIADPAFHTKETNGIDVQAMGPGTNYTFIFEGGAGSPHDQTPASFGDLIFHCHLYPHFANGLWALNRVHNVLETGSNPDGTRRTYPDGTPVLPLVPLEDIAAPPPATADKPGFPFFVPGAFGFKAPKPPLGVTDRAADGVQPPTALEQAAAEPDARIPGSYFVNTCPAGAPLKRFDVAAIQLKATYNDDLDWTNPQHRMYVLQEDKAAVLAGRKRPEPLSPLLNVGDCVEYRFTNELPEAFGGTAFDRKQITNEAGIHQHLVLFDVLSSDGTANGWNYDEGADPGQTIVFRNFVNDDAKTNSWHDHFFPNVQQDNGLFAGSTIHPPGCTFYDPTTGDPVKVGTIVDVRCTPASDYHGNLAKGEDYRTASLFVQDETPAFQPLKNGDKRLVKYNTPDGVPIFPPAFPSAPGDNGVMGVNYRLEPMEARRSSDPANLFSSRTHGDPYTPLPRAYGGDTVKFRLFQLSHEESHVFNLHRYRWKQEEKDPDSNVVQAQHTGMLEWFDVNIPLDREEPNPDGAPLRDYLWYYGGADDWFIGNWGLFRVYGCDVYDPVLPKPPGLLNKIGPVLQRLPDNVPRSCLSSDLVAPSARPMGNPCPTDATGAITAPVRRFAVVAIQYDVVYNGAGDHDPNGVIYVLQEDLAAVKSGAKRPEPLTLRANAGDCVEVTLENQIKGTGPGKIAAHCYEALEPGQMGFKDPASGGATLPGCLDPDTPSENNIPGWEPYPVSARISLNAKMVDYHTGSDGANVGTNWDSTVGPGDKITYRWYAPVEGTGVLGDRADVQNHLHHGAFGTLLIEPRGSTYLDPKDGTPLSGGQAAVIVDPNGPDFREHVALMNSDLSLFQANGQPVADNVDLSLVPSKEEDDPEDQGEFSIGYRNEPWVHRALRDANLAHVFSSGIHGDPATPLFRAYGGDSVRFRVAQSHGDPRASSFTLHGHKWRRTDKDPGSHVTAIQGQLNPGVAWNVFLNPLLYGGAGGPNATAGDYVYRSNTLFRHLTGGQWGLFRVHADPQPDLIKLPDRG